MSAEITTEPATTPVSLDEVKAHLRVDFADEDELITGMIGTATEMIEAETGLALINREYEVAYDCLHRAVILPVMPAVSVASIQFLDTDNTLQTIDSADYRLIDRHEKPQVIPAYGKVWPTVLAVPESVFVRYVAGHGENPADVPETLRQAVLKTVASLYEVRANYGDMRAYAVPQNARDLISSHIRWRF